MQDRLDAYGTDSAARYAEQLRAHRARLSQLEEDHKQFLSNWLDGDADDGAHTDVGQQGHSDASLGGPATPGSVPADQLNHDAELAAADIKNMDMATYAKRRAEFGIRNPTDMSRLFGE